MKGKRDPKTFKIVYAPDPDTKVDLVLFAKGYSYKFLGLLRTDRHLIGVREGHAEDAIFLLGTDLLGRDLWSRLMLAKNFFLSTVRPCSASSKPTTVPRNPA